MVHGDHDLLASSKDDPTELSVHYFVRCRRCGWYVCAKATLEFPPDSASVFRRLFSDFAKVVPVSCSEARDVSFVSAVMES